MTPIDNAVLSEMLDNALSDIEYLRAERNALREAKAEAKAEAYDLKEELVEHGLALDLLADRTDELEKALKRAIARADENADKYNRSERQVEDLRAELQRYKEALRISIRETSDAEDQLALYQDNCECAL